MKKKTLINVGVVLVFVLVFVSESFSQTGLTGWGIFRRPQSTKPKAVTAVASIRGDLSGVFYNPSLLGTLSQKEIFILTEAGLADDMFGGLLYGIPIGESAGFSVGVVYYDAGKVTLYWMEAGEEQSADVTVQMDMLGIVSYGQKLGNSFYFGLSGKYATSNIAETSEATAIAFDAGIFLIPSNSIAISLAGQNIGTSTEFIETAEKLPASVWLGASYTTKSVSFGVDVPYILDEERIIPSVGIDFMLGTVSFNVGYRLNVEESVLHIGFGVTSKSFDFGYAFIPATYLASTHRVTLGFKF